MEPALPALLRRGLLRESVADLISFRDFCVLTGASREVRSAFCVPQLPAELLAPIPGSLHIRRELALGRLMELGRRRSPGAVGEILARLRCVEEHDYLRCWALRFLLPLAQPGDSWAADACVVILELGGSRSRIEALKGIVRLATSESSPRLLQAVIGVLSADEHRGKADSAESDMLHTAWWALEQLSRLLPPGGPEAGELLGLLSAHLESLRREAVSPATAQRRSARGSRAATTDQLTNCLVEARRLPRPLRPRAAELPAPAAVEGRQTPHRQRCRQEDADEA